jgi:hypothetical protein
MNALCKIYLYVTKGLPILGKTRYFLINAGEGAYSSVYKAKRLIDNEIYAIKKVKLNNLNDR